MTNAMKISRWWFTLFLCSTRTTECR